MNCLFQSPLHLVIRSKMKLYIASLLLFFFSQALGEDVSESQLKEDILKKLLSPNDTSFEADAKDLIAQYLVQTVLEDNGIVAFKNKDKDKDKPRDKPREKPNKPHRHKPHKPHTDYRDPLPTASPISNNNAINNAAIAQSAPASDTGTNSQSRQDVTQVPILTAAPAGSNPNTAAPGAVATNAPTAANPAPAPAATAAPVPETAPTVPGITRPTVSPEHVYNQVDKILGNVASGNIVGIVDESLAIRAPTPVRNFVTGILKVIFCNPVDRILGRCRPNSSGAISSVQGG